MTVLKTRLRRLQQLHLFYQKLELCDRTGTPDPNFIILGNKNYYSSIHSECQGVNTAFRSFGRQGGYMMIIMGSCDSDSTISTTCKTDLWCPCHIVVTPAWPYITDAPGPCFRVFFIIIAAITDSVTPSILPFFNAFISVSVNTLSFSFLLRA